MINKVWALKVIKPIASPIEFVRVYDTKEKGSDVNLASHLIHDGYRGRFDQAAVITNDSDLVEPIRIVNKELGFPVGIISPGKFPNRNLLKEAAFIRQIRPGVLSASQFPEQLRDKDGLFHKPDSW
jgi:hypothetical protein